MNGILILLCYFLALAGSLQDILATVGCSVDALLSDCVVTTTSLACDSSFLVHHFVALYLKKGFKVCLASHIHTLQHYSTVAAKLGVNIAALQKKGSFSFVDGMTMFGDNILGKLMSEECIPAGHQNNVKTKFSNMFPLKTVYENLKVSLQSLSLSPGDKLLIVFDNLSVFIELGYSLADVISLFQYLHNLQKQTGNQTALVIGIENSFEDDDLTYLGNYLSHQSDLLLQVSCLDSGYSTDVNGKVFSY